MKYQQETSQDSLFNGELVCYQHKHGYRFSMDAVLLAHFSLSLHRATVLDLGCGCGVLAMILLYRKNDEIFQIHGLEYQHSLAKLAKQNSRANGFTDKFTINVGDYRKLSHTFQPESFTNVICNPPFYSLGKGRTSAHEEIYLARHQVKGSLAELAKNVFFVLKNKGVLTIIYPAEQFAELLSTFLKYKLQPKRVRLVYSYPEVTHASLVMVELKKNGASGMKVASPLFIYVRKNGPYSDEVALMYHSNSDIPVHYHVS